MEGPGGIAPGTRIGGRYRLEALLGQGAFGAVYRALDEASGVRVALKVISPRSVSDAGGVQRVHREAELVSRLQHPNSVRVVGAGNDTAGWLFIAFELLDGRSLETDLYERGALSEARAASIAVDVLSALEEAHARGIVHRDIKPGNIFIARSGSGEQVKVLDFGIAKSTNPGTLAGLTQAGAILGTPLYMAPEQVTAQPVTPRTDLFALGIVLAEILFGCPIYGETNPLAIMTARAMGTPVPIPPVVLALRLGPIIARATEVDPARRFSSATEMRMAIQAAIPALPPSPSIATGATQVAMAAAPSSHPSRVDLAHSATIPGMMAVSATPAALSFVSGPQALPMAVSPPAAGAKRRSNARIALLTGGATVVVGGIFAAGLAAAGAFSSAPRQHPPMRSVGPPSSHPSEPSTPHTSEGASPPASPRQQPSQPDYLEDIDQLAAIRQRDVPPGGIDSIVVERTTILFLLAFPDKAADRGSYIHSLLGNNHGPTADPTGKCAIDFDAIDLPAIKRAMKEAPALNGDQAVVGVAFKCVQASTPPLTVTIETEALPSTEEHAVVYDGRGHLIPHQPQ